MKTGKVCIVNDDAIIQVVIKKMIAPYVSSEDIISFSNGKDAYNYLLDNADQEALLPDIMFLDINMPYMDGLQLLHKYTDILSMLVKRTKIYIISSTMNENEIKEAKSSPHVTGFIQPPLISSYFDEVFKRI
ncbi:MAG: response regulator [Bacteroidetes bacterium]|nr:response regulator [Bacteroidota bacterium]